MLLSREEKKQLLTRFPSLELSYENVLHKKVYADVYALIPKGQKAFVWFTYWQDKNVCFALHLNDKNNICDIVPYPTCFASSLALNTVIYGTLFSSNNMKHFTCEQLFYYKNQPVEKTPFLAKWELLTEMFATEIKQVAYTSDFLILGLPIMKTNYDQMLACLNGLAYEAYGIQCLISTQSYVIGMVKLNKPVLPEVIFRVKAALEADIYHLYCLESEVAPYATALVPSYKASVFLNSLFRRIKENQNLDLLEESDDEMEYEDMNLDKFVDLDKAYNMRCTYNRKFRKWQPVEVVVGGVVSLKDPRLHNNTF
jgi:hypothetical protein